MPRHVDPEALAALVEGRLSGAALEATLRDVAACPHCRRKHDDYAAVLRIAARAYGPGRSEAAGATPAEVDRFSSALEAHLRRYQMPNPQRRTGDER